MSLYTNLFEVRPFFAKFYWTIRGGVFPGLRGICPWGSSPGGSYPGGNFQLGVGTVRVVDSNCPSGNRLAGSCLR